ncbi:MAG: phage gp6-like head-tail connector protein [Rhodospirillaceae bacterium]|nr:phage gp6-like head-tail connector protein [Rhodospirillaceae bacterium]
MPVSRFVRGSSSRADDSGGSGGSTTGNVAPTLAETKDALRIDDDALDGVLTRQIAAGVERANRQAPSAPGDTWREAVLRYVAHLYEMAPGEESSPTGVWRRSGAEGLLAPWTIRRAGVIAE